MATPITPVPVPAPVPGSEVQHRTVRVGDTALHVATAGDAGSPVLLVHGFPETWWVFHRLMPLLAARHRVVAVDLRGFGDSAVADDAFTSAIAAADLHALVAELGLGPVHVLGQDVAGSTVARLAATHPDDVRSLTAVEAGLAGYGLEALADVTHGGSWHIGALAAPGVPEMLLAGRERVFLESWFAGMVAVPGAVTPDDVAELARTFARPGGWRGAAGLYRSLLTEGEELRALLTASPVAVPVLAVGGGGGAFTEATMTQVSASRITAVQLDGVGHHVALEVPEALAEALLAFWSRVDGATS